MNRIDVREVCGLVLGLGEGSPTRIGDIAGDGYLMDTEYCNGMIIKKECYMKAIVTAVVLVAGMLSANLAVAEGDAAAGEAVFNRVCKMCHGSGVMGAPKVGDTKAWSGRIEQGSSKLTQHAINGYNKMPPRGNCKSCSDEDIANAVTYMLSKLK